MGCERIEGETNEMSRDRRRGERMYRLVRALSQHLFLLGLLLIGPVFFQVSGQQGERPVAAAPSDPDEARLWAEFDRDPDGQVRFIAYLRDRPDLSPAYELDSRAERGAFVYQALRQTAEHSQAQVLAALKAQSLESESQTRVVDSLWICNALVLEGNQAAARALAEWPEVERLTLDERRQYLPDPSLEAPTQPSGDPPQVEWNLTRIGADRVWQELDIDGQGVVVANIDTGVLFDHPALVASYRGNLDGAYDHHYNWYDATGTYPREPDDGHGHGTHTIGTVVGATLTRTIGVAPGAQWIAVKGLSDWGYGSDSQIHAAFQWVLAPTDLNGENPDPSRAPHVVNNSWGSPDGTRTVFHADIEALIAAGIIPVFSAGNRGPHPGSIGSPSSFERALAVGALDTENYIAYFSSRGPSPLTPATKPEVAAPGVDVTSSFLDGGYVAKNGTSMAAPHVTGVAALMLQANPLLDYDRVRGVITDTARDLGPAGPDYDYGWGMLNAYAAVDQVQALGRLSGQVRDGATGQGVGGALLAAEGQDVTYYRQTTANAQGYYTLPLPVGAYSVTVSAFGYYSTAFSATLVSQDQPVTHDPSLTARPRHRLSGRVTDGASGAPLSATLTLLDTPAPPAVTDPATGAYEMQLPEGTYTLEADSFGYEAETRVITAYQELYQDFELVRLAPLLLVDDDGGLKDEAVLETTLTTLGQPFQVWDVYTASTPPGDYLRQFPIVVWSTGVGRDGDLSYAEQEAIMTYLDGGGGLLLSSPSHLNNKRQTPLMPDYLHVAPSDNIVKIAYVAGVDGSPIGAWMGTISVTQPAYYVEAMLPDESALPAFAVPGHVLAATYHDRDRWYRAAFFSVGLQALEPTGLQALLHRVIRWFGQGQTHGDLVGYVGDQNSGQLVPEATVRADGLWDGYAVTSDESGHYALSLMVGNYDLSVSRPGYFSLTLPNLTVFSDIVTTQPVSLTPQVTFSPTHLAHNLVAGELWTTALTIRNAGQGDFYYGSYQQAVWGQVADVTATLQVPLSPVPPTIDGVYQADEWADAKSVFLTPLDQPDGPEMGQAWVKQAAGNLYVLLDYEGKTSSYASLKGQIWLDRDRDGTAEAGLQARLVDQVMYREFDYPAWVAAKRTSTPGDPSNHWVFEFEIPLESAGLSPGGQYPIYFYLYDSWLQKGGEWGNLTSEPDKGSPELWETMYLAPERARWLQRAPVGGHVGAQVSHTLAITLNGQLAQPGQHAAELVLNSRHQRYPLIQPAISCSLTVTPAPDMGRLEGQITDRRTGRPLTATLSQVGGLTRVQSNPVDGSYALWLGEGAHQLAVEAEGYLTRYLSVTFGARVSATRHITLQFDGPELNLASSPNLALSHGDDLLAHLLVGNQGSQPLRFQLLETTAETDLPPDAAQTAWGVRSLAPSPPQPWPAPLEREPSGAPLFYPPADLSLSPFLFDPAAESQDTAVDLIRGEAAVRQGVLYMRLTFSPTSDLWHTVGYLHLDTDRDASTGRPPASLLGKGAQDVGFDYYLNLFPMPWAREIDLWRADGQYVGTVSGRWGEDTLEWGLPLAWLGSVDGVMDVTMVLGDQDSPTDWGPARGHSTLGLGANWLVETPDGGVVPPAYSGTLALPGSHGMTVTLSFDGDKVQPGLHPLRLALFSNDPVSPSLHLPLTVTVAPAADMRRVVGRVVDCRVGRRAYALVSALEAPYAYTYTDRRTGEYELWLEPGTWSLQATVPPLLETRIVTIDATTPQPLVLDFVLGECSLYLPVVFK